MAEDKKSSDKKKTKRPTAIKRDIQNEKRRLLNKAFKSEVRTSVRTLEEAMQGKNKETVQAAVNEVYSLMDKGVKRNLFKKNKAARAKSQAATKLASLNS